MPNKAWQKRLLSLARDFYNKPLGKIPERCEGEAKVKGRIDCFSDTKSTIRDRTVGYTLLLSESV